MLTLTASDIMTRNVFTVKKGASVEQALKLMSQHRVSGLPVVDGNDDIAGIITESDLLLKGQIIQSDSSPRTNGLFSPSPDGVDEAYRRAQGQLVEDAMTTKIIAFTEESLIADIARAMIENAINRVPIVDGRKVVGIVSRRDVIRAMAREAEATKGAHISDTQRVIEL